MPYPEGMVAPMRAELTNIGVQELKTIDEVNNFFSLKELYIDHNFAICCPGNRG